MFRKLMQSSEIIFIRISPRRPADQGRTRITITNSLYKPAKVFIAVLLSYYVKIAIGATRPRLQ